MGLFGTSCMFSPIMTYVSRWFDRRRGGRHDLRGSIAGGRFLADRVPGRHHRVRLAPYHAGVRVVRWRDDPGAGGDLPASAAAAASVEGWRWTGSESGRARPRTV